MPIDSQPRRAFRLQIVLVLNLPPGATLNRLVLLTVVGTLALQGA
jgi:hypothetical protein